MKFAALVASIGMTAGLFGSQSVMAIDLSDLDVNELAMSQGSISPRDYKVQYSGYPNTEEFCKSFRTQCINTVGPVNYHHQMDCVFNQRGPTVKSFCGGKYKAGGSSKGSGAVYDFTSQVCSSMKGCRISGQPSHKTTKYQQSWGSRDPQEAAGKSIKMSSQDNTSAHPRNGSSNAHSGSHNSHASGHHSSSHGRGVKTAHGAAAHNSTKAVDPNAHVAASTTAQMATGLSSTYNDGVSPVPSVTGASSANAYGIGAAALSSYSSTQTVYPSSSATGLHSGSSQVSVSQVSTTSYALTMILALVGVFTFM